MLSSFVYFDTCPLGWHDLVCSSGQVNLYLCDAIYAYVECRLDTKYPLCNMFRLFMCAVCQVEMKPGEGVSIHYGSSNPGRLRPWDGPFLCLSCQEKKEAMEGKRSSGGMTILLLPLLCFENLTYAS